MKTSVISTVFRLAELVTIIVCLILHFQSLRETDPLTIVLTSGTFFGYTIVLVGWFAVKNNGNPIHHTIDIGISSLGCALFIATGAFIFLEWSRNDVVRIKKCLPDNYSADYNIVQKIITFLTHTAADAVASKLDKVGYTKFLYSSDTMAVAKASLSICTGILFIFDIVLTNNVRGMFQTTEALETQTRKF